MNRIRQTLARREPQLVLDQTATGDSAPGSRACTERGRRGSQSWSAAPAPRIGRPDARPAPQHVGELFSAARVSGGHESAGEHQMPSRSRSLALAGVSIIAGIGWVLVIVLLWSL